MSDLTCLHSLFTRFTTPKLLITLGYMGVMSDNVDYVSLGIHNVMGVK